MMRRGRRSPANDRRRDIGRVEMAMALVCRERRIVRALLGFWFVSAAAFQVSPAAAQSAAPPIPATQEAGPPEQADNPGDDFDRPLNLFQLLYGYRTAPGRGAQKGAIGTVTTDTLNFRLDHRIDIDPQWRVGLRADLPLLAKNPISAENPAGEYLYGLGDADVQAALIHDLNARWTVGAGARLITPTGDDALGSGKWQIMPGFAVRYALSEFNANSYLEPLLRYDVSFAGDPSKRNISNLQFAPTFNLGLPDRWFFTFYPSADIRVNYGPPVTGQTGRLFLPFDARIGRKLSEDLALSLEVGLPIIKDYPVYDFKTQVRLNLTF
jgi:hypothetical protein